MLGDTAKNIINDAAVEVGLPKTDDPFASTDPNIQKLCAFLKSLGRDLVRRYEWPQLRRRLTLTTILNQSFYELPSDFGRLVGDTGYTQDTFMPAMGPSDASSWALLNVFNTFSGFTTVFRMAQGGLLVQPENAVPAGLVTTFEYISANWLKRASYTHPGNQAEWTNPFTGEAYIVLNGNGLDPTSDPGWISPAAAQRITGATIGGPAHAVSVAGVGSSAYDIAEQEFYFTFAGWNTTGTPALRPLTHDSPEASGDLIFLDSQLLVKGLQVMWKGKAGLPYQFELDEFETALEQAMADEPKPILSIGGRTLNVRRIDGNNLPPTGYGRP